MNDLVDSLNKLEVGDENENDEEDGDESENEEEESETTFVLHPRSKITLFRALLGGCGFDICASQHTNRGPVLPAYGPRSCCQKNK